MRQSRFSRYVWLVPAAALALVAAGVLPAAAAEGEDPRGEYTERAEPICKRNVQANKRIFKGAKGEVKRGKLKKASRHFFRASRAFGKATGRLAKIPRPEADRPRLKRWFGLLRDEKKLILKIGRALRSGKKKRAESLSVDLDGNSRKANNAVVPFGFDYCRLEQSRFG